MASKKKNKIELDAKILLAILGILVIGVVMVYAAPGGNGGGKGGGGNAGATECADGIDNDGDGTIDWRNDPGCTNKKDGSELNLAIECDDGIDNDADGLTDATDLGCSSLTDPDESNCGDGICEGGESSNTCVGDCAYPDSCTDSDGGFNVLIQGTTNGIDNGNPYSHEDSCANSNIIVEYYCSGTNVLSAQQSCGVGTQDDICLNGYVYTNSTAAVCNTGECTTENSLALKEMCTNGCTQGSCNSPIDGCLDTDGGFDTYVQGTVSGTNGGEQFSITDSCASGTMLIETWCSGNTPSSQQVSCNTNSTSICSNGACN